MIKKTIFLPVILIAAISFALSPSDNAGTTGFSFLLGTDVGARAPALGGAWAGWGKSADGFAYNPAATGFSRGRSVIASFGNFWGLFNSGFTGYIHELSDNDFVAAGLQMVSYGKFTETNTLGEVLGEFSGSDFGLNLTYSRKIKKQISAGITTKFLFSNVDTFCASAVAFDAGVMYRARRDNARVGLVISNFGSFLSTYGDVKPAMPWLIKLGGFYNLPGFPGEIGAQVETGAEVDYRVRAGMELDFLKPVYLRAGYILRPKPKENPSDSEQLNGLTAGIGIDYRKYTFSYSMQHYGVLGFVHRAAIGYVGF